MAWHEAGNGKISPISALGEGWGSGFNLKCRQSPTHRFNVFTDARDGE
jgi:hypothetical protein